MKKRIVGVSAVIIILLLVAGAVMWLFMSGRLTLTWNSNPASGQVQTASTHIVCDDATVTTYNTAATYTLRAGSQVPTLDTDGLKKLTSDIKTRSGYQDDPTCQTILFWQAIGANDYATARDTFAILQTLHNKHLYPDNNLMNAQSFAGYSSALEAINPTKTPAQPGQ
ncbi:MAG TPA: hypothetical protein VN081_06245 [Dongiaceae bacterium]|nr:hypothetical protein [Dongiaceae bacterium]